MKPIVDIGEPATEDLSALEANAYASMDSGNLAESSQAFAALLQRKPDSNSYHYMRGLATKYLPDWPVSLHHNLRAIELAEEAGEAEHWNAAIAATALGEWAQARRLWAACGIRVPEGAGPIDDDYGVAVVRLNPWHGGETVFMRRIDPVRARLLNVPLPESGHRFGDIVLHDGASTGTRFDGDREVPVFNELARLVPSTFQTFVALVGCDHSDDVRALVKAGLPGIGFAEDWTDSVQHYCIRCSYGKPHRHTSLRADAWQADRNVGVAAQSRRSVEKLLGDWVSAAPGRRIDSIETRESAIPERQDGHVWWRGPEDQE